MAGYWTGKREISLKWTGATPRVSIINKAVPPLHKDVDFSLFWQVWDRLVEQYLDSEKINSEKMVYGAIQGMTAALGDPYTVFLPPQQQTESRQELAGTFGGVGIQLGYKNNKLAVIAPLDGTPAAKAGVEAGDIIIHIKDADKGINVNTEGMSLPDAVSAIRGEKGKPVNLTLLRGAKDPFEVTLVRDVILVKSVTVEFIKVPKISNASDVSKALESISASDTSGTFDTFDTSGVIAYVRLSHFGDRTASEWNDVVGKIIKESNLPNVKLDGMVLDLRNDPGGYLDSAVKITSEFFKDGIVVEQKGKVSSRFFQVERPGRLLDIPLTVLVNGGSASASEIVSGAIQARGRGKLVGVNTFGKGTVQDAQELPGGAGIHITTARWLLPNGAWIHEQGLKPDVEVEYDKNQSEGKKWDNQVTTAIKELLSLERPER